MQYMSPFVRQCLLYYIHVSWVSIAVFPFPLTELEAILILSHAVNPLLWCYGLHKNEVSFLRPNISVTFFYVQIIYLVTTFYKHKWNACTVEVIIVIGVYSILELLFHIIYKSLYIKFPIICFVPAKPACLQLISPPSSSSNPTFIFYCCVAHSANPAALQPLRRGLLSSCTALLQVQSQGLLNSFAMLSKLDRSSHSIHVPEFSQPVKKRESQRGKTGEY